MLKPYKDILLEWEEKDKKTIEKLHSLGLEWGEGDDRNPEEIRLGTKLVHTNCVQFWIKWRGVWKNYSSKLNPIKILCLFDICNTQEDIDEMLELL